MTTFALYSDWMLETRGSRTPHIGDKIRIESTKNYIVSELNKDGVYFIVKLDKENNSSSEIAISRETRTLNIHSLNGIYVELPEYQSDAIEFANFILNYKINGGLNIQCGDKYSKPTFSYSRIGSGTIDVAELYKQFKNKI